MCGTLGVVRTGWADGVLEETWSKQLGVFLERSFYLKQAICAG